MLWRWKIAPLADLFGPGVLPDWTKVGSPENGASSTYLPLLFVRTFVSQFWRVRVLRGASTFQVLTVGA
jgi:hypothetical protein